MPEPRDPERKKPVTRMHKADLVDTGSGKAGLTKADAVKDMTPQATEQSQTEGSK
jgi:hypothetical protein